MRTMKLETRIRQSQVRVRSGIRLVLFLAVAAIAAYAFKTIWLAQLLGWVTTFFCVVTLAEYYNAHRLTRRLRGSVQPHDPDV